MLLATDADASPERVRLLQKALAGAPLVVIARALCVDTVIALLRAGVSDVIGLPAPVSDVVARASLHAAPIDGEAGMGELSPPARQLEREIAAAAPLRSTVLTSSHPCARAPRAPLGGAIPRARRGAAHRAEPRHARAAIP